MTIAIAVVVMVYRKRVKVPKWRVNICVSNTERIRHERMAIACVVTSILPMARISYARVWPPAEAVMRMKLI